MQDQPDQATLSMGNGPDSLIVSQAGDRPAINNLEMLQNSLDRGTEVSSLRGSISRFHGNRYSKQHAHSVSLLQENNACTKETRFLTGI
jgi:hypothetical protein